MPWYLDLVGILVSAGLLRFAELYVTSRFPDSKIGRFLLSLRVPAAPRNASPIPAPSDPSPPPRLFDPDSPEFGLLKRLTEAAERQAHLSELQTIMQFETLEGVAALHEELTALRLRLPRARRWTPWGLR